MTLHNIMLLWASFCSSQLLILTTNSHSQFWKDLLAVIEDAVYFTDFKSFIKTFLSKKISSLCKFIFILYFVFFILSSIL